MLDNSKNELAIQSQKPNILAPQFDGVPIELKQLPSWLTWKLTFVDSRENPWTKVPWCGDPDVTGQARSNDPASWCSFDAARQSYLAKDFDGVGFVIIGDLIGLDLDKCRDPETGFIEFWAALIIDRINSYTEISPSGTGVRIFCRGKKNTTRCRVGGFEVYDHTSPRFMTVSGAHLEGTPQGVKDRQPQLDEVCLAMFPPEAIKSPVDRAGGDYSPEVAEVLEVVRRAANAEKALTLWERTWENQGLYNSDESRADAALSHHFAPYVPDVEHLDKLFRESPHYRAKDDYHIEKWERDDYRLATLQNAIDSRGFVYEWQVNGEAEAVSICTGGVMPTVATVTVIPAADDMQALYAASQTPAAKSAVEKNKKGRGKGKKASPVAALEQLALDSGMQLFNGNSTAFATISINGHLENWPVDSSVFKSWIAKLAYRATNKVPNDNIIKQFIAICTINAHEKQSQTVYNRVARIGSTIWWDLCNDAWEVIEITASGYKVISDPPVKFIRGSDAGELPQPVAGSLDSLAQIINTTDSDSLELIKGFLIDCIKGRHPYFVLCITGVSGAAKSTTCEIVKSLIDPAKQCDLAAVPRTEHDFAVDAKNEFVLGYDNITKISPAMSDMICRAATGAGIKTRKLYSDSDRVVLRVANPVILNGIPDIVQAQDLVSRVLVVELDQPATYRSKDEVINQLNGLKPSLVGALAASVSDALRLEGSVVIERLPRQADSLKWIVAALGSDWVGIYETNRKLTAGKALEGRPTAKLIRKFMKGKETWEGSTDTLYSYLQTLKAGEIIDGKSEVVAGWLPDNTAAFGKMLKQDAPALRDCWGIEVVTKHTEKGTKITLRSLNPN